jgi:UDP-N-acetylmuramoyl-L-alanyl-D-glutamate--2,6-diaminopimelate ligase
MRLGELARLLGLPAPAGPDPELSGVAGDSRITGPGDLFAAMPGTACDGRDFIGAAAANGAAAVIAPEGSPALASVPLPMLTAPAEGFRGLVARAAREVYGRPDERLKVVAVTGTNGKSTVAHLMEAILSEAGEKTGLMGTICYRWPGTVLEAPNTTPEGPLLYRTLAAMAAAGCRWAVMEASSHALDLGRVRDLRVEAALFTNLSRDHLDHHGTMEDYYRAKRRLFIDNLGDRRFAAGSDDPMGRRLAAELETRAVTFGLGEGADVRGTDVATTLEGVSMTVTGPGAQSYAVRSPLLGSVGALNLLGAAALASILGIDSETVASALAKSAGAPGRLRMVGGRYRALIDYAHTPSALAAALESARSMGPGRLIAVFGCGGDRDRGKRPLMGREAGRGSDLAILTSDNPRTEDPMAIIGEAAEGLRDLGLREIGPESLGTAETDGAWPAGALERARGSFVVEPDRRKAIRLAIGLMDADDLVLIAGKGHEDYQILGRTKIRFDDAEEALGAMRGLGRL